MFTETCNLVWIKMKENRMISFKANGLPLLIGSLPMDDHEKATRLVLDHTPEIPLWVQLPMYREEGMVDQFIQGLPGYKEGSGKNILDTSAPEFDQEMLSFFEDFLSLSESDQDLDDTRFALSGKRGKGFAEFLKQIDESQTSYIALKGQVSGPITFGTAAKDQNDKDIFYNDQLKDAAIKKLALNARWQARHFAKRGATPIIFIDEPALAGFGTSAYITITKEDVTQAIEEIAQEVHAENGLVGVHVCANTQWDMLLTANIDVISFDAFSYFDKFILYPDEIKTYLNQGKILAIGVVPTSKASTIAEQTTQGLAEKFTEQINTLSEKTGIDRAVVLSQSFVTPSCGTGSLDFESAKKVLELTRDVSALIRKDQV